MVAYSDIFTDILSSACSFLDCYVCFRIRSHFKKYGVLPDEGSAKVPGCV
jgi:hypothetical protein